jgi:hypothetical protein
VHRHGCPPLGETSTEKTIQAAQPNATASAAHDSTVSQSGGISGTNGLCGRRAGGKFAWGDPAVQAGLAELPHDVLPLQCYCLVRPTWPTLHVMYATTIVMCKY